MTNQSRREFLENSMFATAAALGASQAMRPLSLFADDKPAAGPNEVLRVGIIGLNGRGKDHVGGYLRNKGKCEIVATCDADTVPGQRQTERIEKDSGKKPKFYQDMRKMLENKDIDVISIATPNHWHALSAIWAMQAGKDVYVEKPVSHNVSEGRRIVEFARKLNKICQTGTQCRSMPGTRLAIEYLKAGKIGEVKLARGLCYKSRGPIGQRGHYEPPTTVDYDLWCGPAPKSELTRPKMHYDWHWVWETGNGDLGNQGIHQMDIARWGLGVNDIGNSVVSYGGRLGYTDAGDTANTQVSVHDYGDKTLVFEVRGLKTERLKGAGVGVIFYGSDGYIVLDDYTHGVAFDPSGKPVKEFSGGADHYGNFLDAVKAKSSSHLNADILEGHLSSALCHLGNISLRSGDQLTVTEYKERLGNMANKTEVLETYERFTQHLKDNGMAPESTKISAGMPLTIDPKAEIFTGEHASKVNPMLTRDYRPGFVVPAKA